MMNRREVTMSEIRTAASCRRNGEKKNMHSKLICDVMSISIVQKYV